MVFRKPRTTEQLKKITAVRTGLSHKPHKKHIWKEGHSDATKKKISEALKGHVASRETKQKLAALRRGKGMSDETKKKISDTQKARLAQTKMLSALPVVSIVL